MKREMFKDFRNSSCNILFVTTKYYNYKIVKLDGEYKVIATEKGQIVDKITYWYYKDLSRAIIGNVQFYEMDFNILGPEDL